MVERIIRISPNGNEIEFIYTDKLVGLKEIGKMEALRVSDVVFNPKKQKWQVCLLDALIPNGILFEAQETFFDKREQAIDAEVKWLEKVRFGV